VLAPIHWGGDDLAVRLFHESFTADAILRDAFQDG
jgi:hypothetical protein